MLSLSTTKQNKANTMNHSAIEQLAINNIKKELHNINIDVCFDIITGERIREDYTIDLVLDRLKVESVQLALTRGLDRISLEDYERAVLSLAARKEAAALVKKETQNPIDSLLAEGVSQDTLKKCQNEYVKDLRTGFKGETRNTKRKAFNSCFKDDSALGEYLSLVEND